jgi:hypothetical protein
MDSRAIKESLRISPATLTRLVAQAGSPIERIGAARSTRYALRRSVRNLGGQWPIYRIRSNGRPQVWGELRALHGGFRFIPQDPKPAWMEREYSDGIFSGLPFFLQDVRPQGYVGRTIGRDVAPRLGVPTDPRQWNDDDLLSYFLIEGYDVSGDFVVGDRALERALRATEDLTGASTTDADRVRAYPERAASAQRGQLAGSSAGGEQPKFLATVQRSTGHFQSVMVKFSAADLSPVSQRWADLLTCEHLAAETMRAHRIVCSSTQILHSGGRHFLEIERFDRIEAIGRRGLLSLGAIEDAFMEHNSPDWAAAAVALEEAEWITRDEGRTLRWIWCFGDLIANSDMHRANASFWFDDELPYRLTPTYDMLPMLYAPGAHGDLGERDFAPRPPLAGVADVWSNAAAAAAEFWDRVDAEPRISDSFREIARHNREVIHRLIRRLG